MDNSHFRNLLQNGRNAGDDGKPSASPNFKKPALGSRARASIPMTPRSVAGYNPSYDFARQVAEHGREKDGQPPTKKFRSSAAPKGTKLGSGYQDRTMARKVGDDAEETQDDKEKRLKALEEMYKLQQIDEATFENLKTQLGIGGSLGSTHLVKGLDWKLLEKVRRGEDVSDESTQEKPQDAQVAQVDIDEELDHVLDKEVQINNPTSREERDEPSSASHEAMTMTMRRDEILRRLKQSRAGKVEERVPDVNLGGRFKKVSSEKSSNKKKFTEIVNGRRREVLVITNKDGTTKRKTRWIDGENDAANKKDALPLGMEVPAEFLAKQKAMLEQEALEADDDDIFQGVTEYDPLAGIASDSEGSDVDADQPKKTDAKKQPSAPTGDKPRNYFGTSNQEDVVEDRSNPIKKDPMLLAALKRASGLRQSEAPVGDEGVDSDPDRAARQQKLLARLKEQDRVDAADMDLGFGESRFGDEDDDLGAVWEDGEGEKKAGRKRGGKKRKGNKDDVGDVMAVLEGRQKQQS